MLVPDVLSGLQRGGGVMPYSDPEKRRIHDDRCRESIREAAREWREKNRDKVLEAKRRYREARREELRKKQMEYVEKHRDEVLKRKRESNALRRDAILQARKQYREVNKEKISEQAKRCYERTTPARRAGMRRVRARSYGAPGSHTDAEWVDLCAKFDFACVGCGRSDVRLTRDHVIALVTPGSTDYIDNIQPLCRSCNSRKQDRTIDFRINPFTGWQ